MKDAARQTLVNGRQVEVEEGGIQLAPEQEAAIVVATKRPADKEKVSG